MNFWLYWTTNLLIKKYLSLWSYSKLPWKYKGREKNQSCTPTSQSNYLQTYTREIQFAYSSNIVNGFPEEIGRLKEQRSYLLKTSDAKVKRSNFFWSKINKSSIKCADMVVVICSPTRQSAILRNTNHYDEHNSTVSKQKR